MAARVIDIQIHTHIRVHLWHTYIAMYKYVYTAHKEKCLKARAMRGETRRGDLAAQCLQKVRAFYSHIEFKFLYNSYIEAGLLTGFS